MSKLKIAAVTLLAGTLFGCASNGGSNISYDSCVYPDAPEKQAPGWVCEQPVNTLQVQAVGYSSKKAAGPGFMKDIAAQEARNRLAQNFAQQIASEYARYTTQTDTQDGSTSEDKVSQTILGELAMNLVFSRIYQSITSPTGGMYVLVGLDEKAYEENLQRLFNNPIDPENPELFQQFLIDNSKSKLEKVKKEL